MTDESGDDVNDYVVVTRPETSDKTDGEPPHVIQKIKTWLSPTDTTSPASEYRKHLNSHAAGTGEWILDTNQYRRWSDTDEIGDLWIRGIPGSGKSVVAASMVKRLQHRGDAPVLFFFFREIIDANRTPHSLARDFCHGLLDHSPYLQSALEKLESENSDVEEVPFNELWKSLSSALAAMPKVYCVVDALDEMEPGHDQFLQDLLNLGRTSPKSIKLILASRQLPHLEKHLGGSCLLDLRLDRRNVDRDIAIYIDQRLKSEVTLTEDEAAEIKTTICDRGKGLFLYARLVTDQLLLHPATIVSQLSQLPDGLGSMYTNILRDHAARSQTTTEFQQLILECIVYSVRPLRLLELSSMVESLPDRGGLSADQNAKLAIRSTCGPLLEVCEDGVIQIIHHSLTEFLLNRDVSHIQDAGDHREFPVLDRDTAHGTIARSCVNYITFCGRQGLGQSTHLDKRALWQRFPFLRYSSKNWPHHAFMSDPKEDLTPCLDEFFKQSALFVSWTKLYGGLDIYSCSDLTPLHIAAHSGLCAYVEHLLANGANAECLDGYNRTPLAYAAVEGHDEIVQTLLDHKVRYDMVDDDMLTPIHYAAKHNCADVVQILLAEGADPLAPVQEKKELPDGNFRGKYGNFEKGETALSYACRLGHVETLIELQSYIDPLTLCRRYLHLAAKCGQAEIVDLLLNHQEVRRVIDDHDHAGCTAVYLAAKHQNRETVQVLLEHGADINVRSLDRPKWRDGCRISDPAEIQKRSFTTLHGWAQLPQLDQVQYTTYGERKREVLQLLLKAGCDINATDHKGRTALFAWADFFSDNVNKKSAGFVSFLLENGADASIVDLDGGNILHQIDSYPQEEWVFKMLVRAGADINAARKTDGMTPVHIAAKTCNSVDPMLFAQLKADFRKQDLQGNTPLHYICQEWCQISIESAESWLTLSDLSIRNHAGRAPLAECLMRPFWGTRQNNFHLFLKHGANLELRDYQGRTALLISVSMDSWDRKECIPDLLRLGADAKITDFQGKSVLHYSASSETSKMLIEAGADINSIDYDGNSVFHDATAGSWGLSIPYTEDLIELNAPLTMRNHQGRTALHLAAAANNTTGRQRTRTGTRMTWFEFMLQPDLGFDINEQDHQGVTPLHLAAATSDINTRQLIDLGANIQAKTIQGQTALHSAAEAGQSDSLRLLLEVYATRSLKLDELSVEGRTALHEAARSGRYECVKLLLDAGSRPDVCDSKGKTPLHAAAEFDQASLLRRRRTNYESMERNTKDRPKDINKKLERLGLLIGSEEDFSSVREVVQLLLAAGVDPGQRDNDKHTALDVALILGSTDVVDELASSAARLYTSTDDGSKTSILDPVGVALSTPTREIFARLIQTMPTSLSGGVVLKRAISTGNVKLVDELLCSSKVNLTENDRTSALHFCVRWGLLSMAKSVLPYVQDLHGLLPSLLDSAAQRSLCNIEMIKLLVESAVFVSNDNEGINSMADGGQFGSSALHQLASGVHWWYPRALTILLDAGADTELLSERRTPLQTALLAGESNCYEKNLWCDEAFDILLRFGADVNASSAKSESSPLQDAVESNRDIPLIQKLLDHGASVEGKPIVVSAIRANNTKALELLLKAGADPNILYTTKELHQHNSPETPLKHASIRDEALMEVLLTYGANPHQPLLDGTSSVLHEICSLNARINPIIQAKFDLETRDAQGRTPLIRACIPDHLRLRIARDPRKGQSSALELIRAGVDVNAVDDSGSTALHYAICSRLLNIVKELLSHGACPVTRNKHGVTPLHSALAYQTNLSETPDDDECIVYRELVQELLAAGADPLDPLPDGRTALHFIIPALMQLSDEGRSARKALNEEKEDDIDFFDYAALYQTFVDAGCSREARDNRGNTPIFAYVRKRRFYSSDIEQRIDPDLDDMRDTFAKHDIHAVNDAGDTLLHAVASRQDDVDDLQDQDVMIFSLLVELGLDPAAENKDGATPLDLADACGRDEILALFARDE